VPYKHSEERRHKFEKPLWRDRNGGVDQCVRTVLSHWGTVGGSHQVDCGAPNPKRIDMLNFKGMRFLIDVILVCIR
jgi:hypothetical protein